METDLKSFTQMAEFNFFQQKVTYLPREDFVKVPTLTSAEFSNLA